MKNIIIIAQKIDADDDHRGFFIDWLKEFAKQFDTVSVITVAEGTYELPVNIHVYSLGKEKGASKFIQAIRFYRYLLRLIPNSIGIFAHSSPIFVVASWPVAVLWRKKIILWYLHRSVTFKLKLAEKLCYKIVTATSESLRLSSAKIVETGHGISVMDFKTERNWTEHTLRILSVGRMTKIKDYETLIEAAKILKDKGLDLKVKIIGRPVMPDDFEYQKFLTNLRAKLGLNNVVEFVGFVPYHQLAAQYRESDIVAGLTPHGGIDKAILEGMASGCLIVTSNDANRKYFGGFYDKLIFNHHDQVHLSHQIESLNRLPFEQKKEMSEFLVHSVSKHHDLSATISKISRLFDDDQ